MAIRVGTTAHYQGGIRAASTEFVAFGQPVYFITAPAVSARTTNSYTVTGELSAEGHVYAVALLAGATEPSEAQIAAGTDGGDVAALGAGNAATAETTPFTFSVSITGASLDDNPFYNLRFVGRTPE